MIRIPSPSYSAGRVRPARVIVLHTAQCPCEPGRAQGTLGFLANPAVRASAHFCVDPSETVAGVDERDTAWAAPGLNADGIQIEQAGFAEFGSGAINAQRYPQWHTYYGGVWPTWTDRAPWQMIVTQTVPLVADICRRNGFPAKLLEPADLLAGERGITDHSRVTAAYGQGDHWDCGGHYPLADIVGMVGRLLVGAPPISTPEGEDDMPDYLLRALDTRTVIARYPNGAAKALASHELNWLIQKGIPVVDTDSANLKVVMG